MEWAHKQRYEGAWLLEGISPRKRFELPPAKSDSEINRPIADEQRHAAVMDYADQIGQTERHLGQWYLPTILRVARHTGRRRTAIVNLHWRDICLDREACEAALRRDQAPVKRARDWPHGAIHWRAQHNKMGYSSVIPITEELQQALKRYRDNQWLSVIRKIAGEKWHQKFDFPEMPLFPSSLEPQRAISNSVAGDWLRSAKERARKAGRTGAPPADEEQAGYHTYRRWWASERSHYQSDMGQKAVRLAGGWKPRGDTMRRVYLQVPAAELYRVVANREHSQAQTGIVSFHVLGDLVADLVRELSSGSAPESIRRFPDLETHQQRQILWDLIRDVEKKQKGVGALDSDHSSQKVVNSLRETG